MKQNNDIELLIFRFSHYIWFIDNENLCLKEKKLQGFDIVHFPNYEISAAL